MTTQELRLEVKVRLFNAPPLGLIDEDYAVIKMVFDHELGKEEKAKIVRNIKKEIIPYCREYAKTLEIFFNKGG